MILEIDNVELYFKEKCILQGIYLKGEIGQVTSILGSNGCGKSCLLNIIFGNLKPKYKLIRLNNKPILKPLYRTKLVAYLPQHHFIPKAMKLILVFKMFNINWYDFIIYFEAFEIYKNHKFGNLSGGERRIVETYIILRSHRKIILLDEPFSHLAPLQIETFKNIISEEKHQKVIILTDHMYQHIIDVSDHLYLLKNRHIKPIKDLKDLEDFKYLSTGSLN
ncbi:ATP-binding cassette domain-containing protein [Algibacter mikhailovii]|uniref:ABC transporter ATP-binding protein n=1 Tax=Algibacter mikhailovii TaxID=425498 RepID=A0A918QYV5_9FLAO|nr:ABC transporter ATP-binding protein [Algibacter mikhailovii]GGZ77179.1 ABC transporter ATP-binding protein [Algibacter mikhailovii]